MFAALAPAALGALGIGAAAGGSPRDLLFGKPGKATPPPGYDYLNELYYEQMRQIMPGIFEMIMPAIAEQQQREITPGWQWMLQNYLPNAYPAPSGNAIPATAGQSPTTAQGGLPIAGQIGGAMPQVPGLPSMSMGSPPGWARMLQP